MDIGTGPFAGSYFGLKSGVLGNETKGKRDNPMRVDGITEDTRPTDKIPATLLFQHWVEE